MSEHNLRTGQLNRMITIQRRSRAVDGFGQEKLVWTDLTTVPASYEPLGGDERWTSEQFRAAQQVKFTIRWSDKVKDIDPLDRIIYPAKANVTDIAGLNIFDIMAVDETGLHRELEIMTARENVVQ